jgi:hypothetical protein
MDARTILPAPFVPALSAAAAIAAGLGAGACGCGGAPALSAPPVAVAAPAAPATAATPGVADAQPAAADPHDGQRDFDFLVGRWKVQLRKLKTPLHAASDWVEGSGTAVVRPLWGGKAQLDEVEIDTPIGHIEGLTLRLYSTASRQWSLYWASQKNGRTEIPMVGDFKEGRGEFFDQEVYDGRSIYVRYVWSSITATSCHFEQSFSVDGGKTWEANWIAQLTRVE